MPQTPSQSEPGRARGLAKLTGVEAAHEELALYLRSLKERLGMQSRDLAAALTTMAPTDPVSEFQLSRCLGGKQIPKLSLISRMHQLLAQRTGGDLDESGLKAGRVLMFAAAWATGPLQDRAVKLEAALEDVGAQRAETAKELSQLREDSKKNSAVSRACSRSCAAGKDGVTMSVSGCPRSRRRRGDVSPRWKISSVSTRPSCV